MRISTDTIFSSNVSQLDTLSASLAYTQQQVSSGRRILTPADDPAAASQVLQVSQTAATNTQYQANIGAATDAITLGEGALQSVTTLVQSIQTTAVQAGNPSLANSDRATLANTLQSDLSQLISLANTTDAVGNYLFSGFKGATQPFVQVQTPTGPQVNYNGDNGQRSVQVSSSQQIASSDSGAGIFMNIKNGNGTFTTGANSTVQVSGTTIMPGPIAAAVPITYSTAPATFTVDGLVPAVTVNQDVTVAGNGTGPGTLAASIQAGLVAAGLTSYSVASSANGGLEITHTGSTNAVVLTAIADPSNNIVAGQSMAGITAGNSAGSNVMAGATAAGASGPPAVAPYNFSAANATFTVDGTPVVVNQDVTVAGTGTGPGTLAAAIQAGLTSAGLTTYSVFAAPGGGLQIVNNGSSTAVAITNAIDPSGNIVNGPGTAGVTKLPNTGSGVISVGSLSNPPPTAAQLGNSYQITFTGAGTFNITGTDATGAPLPVGTNTLPTPSINVPYLNGQTIVFNGIQFNISGTPVPGDTFVVKPSTNESVFTTIQNLITTLNTPVVPANAASSAQLTSGVNTALNNLSNDLNSVLDAQSSQGTRLNVLSSLKSTEGQAGLSYTTTISTLQDLDYNVGLSTLSEQQTILKAAQESFVQLEGLSIFNYMR